MTEDHKNPPTTIKEVGIHMGYMREGQESMQQDIKDMKKLLDTYVALAASKVDHQALEKRVRVLELTDNSSKYITRMEGRAISAILGMAIALLTLWNLITNKG